MKEKDFWKDSILNSSDTIHDAAKNLEKQSIQIVLVVDKENKFIGTVSDGDIRRGLLQEKNLDDSILSISNLNPLVVPASLKRAQVLQLMQTNKIHQIPIVDNKNNLIGLHLWDDIKLSKERPNQMVIMAGGLGTRLRPHTEDCPKPMLPLGGKPMLEHIILRARAEGFIKFTIALNYLGEIIEDYFEDGKDFNVEISYTHEDEPLGTAGALSLLDSIPKDPFIVTNGDVMTDINYGKIIDFHLDQDAFATMAVRRHEWQNPFGVVKLDGINISGFLEKPISQSYINAGVYVLNPEAINHLEDKKFCDMPTLFERIKQKNLSTIAYATHEEWVDVGRLDDYRNAEENIANIED